MPYLAMPYLAMSYLAMSYLAMPYLAWCHESDAHLDALGEAVLDAGRHRRPCLLLGPHRVRLVGLGVVLEARLEQDAGAMVAARRRRHVVSHC